MRVYLYFVIAVLVLFTCVSCERDKTGGQDNSAPAASAPTNDNAAGEQPSDNADKAANTDEAAEQTEAESDDASAQDADAADETGEPAEEETAAAEPESPEGTTRVVFETTKGDIVFEVHPEWSPLGAEHFLELVNAGFYDGAPWFRVIPGFVAQCGMAADPAMHAEWAGKTIMDEPVIQGNRPEYVAFGKSMMPNSRSTHIFINLVDNTRSLDPQGFACFARVIRGMDVAQQLTAVEGNQGDMASAGGMDRFKQQFPKADFITKAYVAK